MQGTDHTGDRVCKPNNRQRGDPQMNKSRSSTLPWPETPGEETVLLEPRGGAIKWKLEPRLASTTGTGAIEKM